MAGKRKTHPRRAPQGFGPGETFRRAAERWGRPGGGGRDRSGARTSGQGGAAALRQAAEGGTVAARGHPAKAGRRRSGHDRIRKPARRRPAERCVAGCPGAPREVPARSRRTCRSAAAPPNVAWPDVQVRRERSRAEPPERGGSPREALNPRRGRESPGPGRTLRAAAERWGRRRQTGHGKRTTQPRPAPRPARRRPPAPGPRRPAPARSRREPAPQSGHLR